MLWFPVWCSEISAICTEEKKSKKWSLVQLNKHQWHLNPCLSVVSENLFKAKQYRCVYAIILSSDKSEEDSVEMQNLPLTVPHLNVLGTMTLEESLTERKRSNCLHSGRDEWDQLTRAIWGRGTPSRWRPAAQLQCKQKSSIQSSPVLTYESSELPSFSPHCTYLRSI